MARRVRTRHYGGSLALPGVSSYASTTNASLAPGSGSWTIAIWVRPTSVSGATRIIAYSGSYSTTGWGISEYLDALFIYVKNGGPAIYDYGYFTVATWTRVVVVFDATTHTVTNYRNGVLRTSAPAAWTGSVTDTSMILGNTGGASLPGNEADAILDVGHAWTAAQVAADYFDASPPSTYTHRWPLDDGAGTTARATRGGLPLTLGGTAAFSSEPPMIGRGVVRNLVPNSDDFSLSSLSTCTVTPNVAASPVTGAVTADEVHITANGGFCIQSAMMQAGKTYLLSYWIKRAGASNQQFYIRSYDTVSTTYSAQLTATSAWQQFSLMFKSGATASGNVGIFDISNNVPDLIVAGAQLEEVYPGQTTPSPNVPTGAAPLSVYGLREWRQNLLKGGTTPSFAYFSPSTGDSIATGIADPDDGTAAIAYTYPTSTSSFAVLSQIVAGYDASASPWTYSVWLRVPTGTKSLILAVSDVGVQTVTKTITVTSTWQRFSSTVLAGVLHRTTYGIGVGRVGFPS
jgi:hypothetical protein